MKFFIGSIVVVACASTSLADIIQVDYATLPNEGMLDLSGLDDGTSKNGTNFDTLISRSGVRVGERFDGQDLTYDGDFDVLDCASVTDPLTPLAGAANQNLYVKNLNMTYLLIGGLGRAQGGYPDPRAAGEGSIVFAFDWDQPHFGLQIFGANDGPAVFCFFRRNGQLIQTITINQIQSGTIGFRQEDGDPEIAGVSIHNTDSGGISYGNIIYSHVPVPTSAAVFGVALVGAIRRRRR